MEALGGTAVSASLIAFQEALPDECADSLREDLSEPGWLVFTSVNGVRFFFSYLDRHGLALSGRKKIATVGEKTARALKERGARTDAMPDEYVAECLADTLKRHASGAEPISVIKGNLSRDVIKAELEPLGYQIREWVLYNTIQDEKGMDELRRNLHPALILILLRLPAHRRCIRLCTRSETEKKRGKTAVRAISASAL